MSKAKSQLFNSPAWARAVSKYLLKQKADHCLSYPQISERLADMGVTQTPANLANKFKRGNLGAQLFCVVLIAMGEEVVDLTEVHQLAITQES